MFGFGKKDDAKATGGFGLPSLSLGKAEKVVGHGLGHASDTLKNTGEKVEDFLFGHPKYQETRNRLSVETPGLGLGGISLNTNGPTGGSSRVAGTLDKIGGDLRQSGGALKKTGEETIDYLFGKNKNKAESHTESTNLLGSALPGLSFGGRTNGSSSLAGSFNKIGGDLRQSEGVLKKTGEETIDYLFGKNKNKVEDRTERTNLLGSALPSLSFGGRTGGNSSRAGTFNNIGGDLRESGGSLKKTGEEAIDYLFGKNKNKVESHTESTNLLGSALPGLSFGGTSLPSLSEVGGKVNENVGNVGSDVEQTGKKVVDYIFGNKKQTKPVLSFGGIDHNLSLGGDVDLSEKSLTPPLPKLSLGRTNLLSGKDTEKKIDKSLNKIGSGMEETGEKVVNYLFGGKSKTNIQPATAVIDMNENLPKIAPLSYPSGNSTSPPATTNVSKKIQADLGNPENGVEKTSEKVIDYIFEGKSITTIQPSYDFDGRLKVGGLNGKIPDEGGNGTFPRKPNVVTEGDTNPSYPSTTSLPSFTTDVIKPSSVSTFKNEVESGLGPNDKSLDKVGDNKAIDITSKKSETNTTTPEDHKIDIDDSLGRRPSPAPPNLPSNISNLGKQIEITTESNYSFSIDAELTTVGDSPGSVGTTLKRKHELNINSPMNSLEESANGLFGVSEMPINQNTKSEETLRRIEDILQGSGKMTTSPLIKTDQNINGNETKPSGKPYTTTNNEVSNEDSTTENLRTSSEITILKASEKSSTTYSPPGVQNPFYLVPNSINTIGEQFTPELPPSVFDKPTGPKAPFIPILPPPMESTMKNIATTFPIKASDTLAPPVRETQSSSLTPVEYGAVGVGSVLLFALIAYIYQKYRQFSASSAGGSYSPKAHHKKNAARKKSTRSNDSEEGTPFDANEIDTTLANTNGINSDVTVVEIEPGVEIVEEVIEMPVTKTIVNDLQKSSANENQSTLLTSEKYEDSNGIISEKPKSAIEKPPRKTRTPTNSPEKFTSDKTSASQLNRNSLEIVSHAIGGILKSQVPNEGETEKQKSEEQPNSRESNDDSHSHGVSLLSHLIDSSSSIKSENTPEDDVKVKESDVTSTVAAKAESIDNGPLCTSLERELDAGSEYFSADEYSDSRVSPPLSPSLKSQFEKFKTRNLRAEDVYNTEVITEDGRRRSIEDDIAESIQSKTDGDPVNSTLVGPTSETSINYNYDPFPPNAPVRFLQIASSADTPINRNISEKETRRVEINSNDSSGDIDYPKVIYSEESNSQRYKRDEAEAIVDDILRTSQLDSLTVQSIRQDLGHFTDMNPNLRLFENLQSCGNNVMGNLASSSRMSNEIINDDNKPSSCKDRSQFLKNDIDAAEPRDSVCSTKNEYHNSTMIANTEYSDLDAKTQEITVGNYKIDTQENIASFVSAGSGNRLSTNPSINSCNNSATGIQLKEDCSTCSVQDSIEEGFPVEHRFEFITPRQKQILEDDLIVFSNSDRESISTLSNSTVESNCTNEEKLSSHNKEEILSIPNSGDKYLICEECGGIQSEELVLEKSNGSESIDKEDKGEDRNRTKWYVPNDEATDLINEGEKSVGGLYIVLSENQPGLNPQTDFTASEVLPPKENTEMPLSRFDKENQHSHTSYAYIDVNNDPRNEGWPAHLPKNIHSISGVGLIKIPEVGSSPYDVLKEEPEMILVNTQRSDDIEQCDRKGIELENPVEKSSNQNQKPIPKFIIPNMDARLSKRRVSKRRQIKSLDSGVHHYYGEYLNLDELPEINDGDAAGKIEKVIEDVITIKPDGTITEEKIIIQNSK